jgi:hypothetical protein
MARSQYTKRPISLRMLRCKYRLITDDRGWMGVRPGLVGTVNTCLRSLRGSLTGLTLLCCTAGTAVPVALGAGGNQPAVHLAPARASGQLGPLVNIPQTWNNCGPASVAEVLAYWGISRTQADVQSVLRADGNPHGMSPYGVPAYARSLGLRAMLGFAGSERLVKLLVTNGFPIIVSQYVSPADHVGHYRPIQAYEDGTSIFVSSDPYLGQNHQIDYGAFDAIWKSTNRRFLLLYPPAKQPLLDRVLAAAGWNHTRAYAADLARVRGLLAGKVHDLTGYGSPRNFELALAWDELQLGHSSAARQDVSTARRLGANPIVIDWIAGEMARGARA